MEIQMTHPCSPLSGEPLRKTRVYYFIVYRVSKDEHTDSGLINHTVTKSHRRPHHHHHHVTIMQLGHLLTRSSLTQPEVS